jgi:hypothetical protein
LYLEPLRLHECLKSSTDLRSNFSYTSTFFFFFWPADLGGPGSVGAGVGVGVAQPFVSSDGPLQGYLAYGAY